MTSLDTIVVVRALTQDDPAQARKAARILRSGDLFVGKTVLIEVAWVLRKAYAFPADRIHDALVQFVSLERLSVEDRPAVVRALEWHAGGLDFADAVHLASSPRTSTFVTFDTALAKTASTLRSTPSVELL